MRLDSLKKSKEALDHALQDLENTRLTPPDHPKLSELKAEIRRAIRKPRTQKRKSGKTSGQK
jgi:hypothetical protein